jgi:hypothetical protein
MATSELDLARIVWSEQGLMELLGAKKNQVRGLRLNHGLPFVRLQSGLTVYLAEDVLEWIERRKGEAAASKSPIRAASVTP